jgi:hypothetical protein
MPNDLKQPDENIVVPTYATAQPMTDSYPRPGLGCMYTQADLDEAVNAARDKDLESVDKILLDLFKAYDIDSGRIPLSQARTKVRALKGKS